MRDVLHLKTGITYLGDDISITTTACAEQLATFEPILLPPEEAYAANCLRINDRVLVPAGFSGAYRRLAERGLDLIALDISEWAKMDGGLTCLSLLH